MMQFRVMEKILVLLLKVVAVQTARVFWILQVIAPQVVYLTKQL